MAKELCIRHPDKPGWLLSLADAIRHGRSLQEGMQALVPAAVRFPEEALMFYTLACYQAQLGYLDPPGAGWRTPCGWIRRAGNWREASQT